jgi:segregation and condensation protein B
MSLKAQVEAAIYAAEEPITLEQLATLLREAVLADLAARRAQQGGEDATPSNSPSSTPGTTEEAASEDGEYAAEAAQLDEMNLDADAGSELGDDAEEPSAAAEQAASEAAPPAVAGRRRARKSAPRTEEELAADKAVRERLRELLAELISDYAADDRGMEIRQIAGGYRMATKPEHHDIIRAFAKSLKPPIRLSLAALETLAVIAYKQPVTAPEIAEIRGVESAGVLGTLLDRRLITTAGRKQVIGRPIQYRTSKDFLLRFGLNDVGELPSMEEFSQLASDASVEIATPETHSTPSLFSPQPDDPGLTEDAPEANTEVEPEEPLSS